MSDYINKYVNGPVQKIGSFFSRTYSNKGPEKIVETVIKHEYEKMAPFDIIHCQGHQNYFYVYRLFLA